MNAPINQVMSPKLYVGNLPIEYTEREIIIQLDDVFGRFGTIVDRFLIRERGTSNHRGFGFVTFDNIESAYQALIHLSEKCIFEDCDQVLKIEMARARKKLPIHANGSPLHHGQQYPAYMNGDQQRCFNGNSNGYNQPIYNHSAGTQQPYYYNNNQRPFNGNGNSQPNYYHPNTHQPGFQQDPNANSNTQQQPHYSQPTNNNNAWENNQQPVW